MPELPEMETYKTLLRPRIVGFPITGIDVQREKSINVPVREFRERVQRRTVTDVSRRAKHLLIHLDSGDVLLAHLMLGGKLFYGTESEKPRRTTQVVLSFGERNLYFIGLRLGYLHVLTVGEAERRLSDLGPDPLDPSLTEERFFRALAGKRTALKSALTDQKTISGIGGCYSDEICFEAGLKPTRKVDSLSVEDVSALYRAMRVVLEEAIRFGGYMETPLFVGDTLTGGFDRRCKVYDRGGEPCVRCGRPLLQDEIVSRKTFYCANCQR
mgnify:CR=1 FL=1